MDNEADYTQETKYKKKQKISKIKEKYIKGKRLMESENKQSRNGVGLFI